MRGSWRPADCFKTYVPRRRQSRRLYLTMAMIVFDLVERTDDGDHSFALYNCRAEEGDLVTVLANTIRALYVNKERLRDLLMAAMSETSAIANTNEIEEAIERTLSAAIPQPGVHPVPQLDVARNELAEALAHVALQRVLEPAYRAGPADRRL